MNARAKTFGSPSGEPSTTRPMPQQMCEKVWTLPLALTITAPDTTIRNRADSSPKTQSAFAEGSISMFMSEISL